MWDKKKEYQFFNNNLNFFHTPIDGNIYGLTVDEFRALLDFFSALCTKKLIEIGFRKKEISILRPFEVVVGADKEYLYIGFTNINAIRGLTSISTFVGEFPSSPYERLKESAFMLGFEIQEIIRINRSIAMASKSELQRFLNRIENKENKISSFPIEGELANELKSAIVSYAEQLELRRNKMIIDPIFKTKDITVDQSLCFTLLPFTDEQQEIFDEIIVPAIKEEFDIQILRANNIFGTNEIMEDIWNYICKSRFLIADITGKNPNVFYELGICHTLGKDVITICDEDSFKNDYNERFPFDISHRRIIVYKNTGAGMKKFKETLIRTIRSVVFEEQLDGSSYTSPKV